MITERPERPAPELVDVECFACGKPVQTLTEYWWVDGERWENPGPPYRLRCDSCMDKYLATMARAREYQSPVAPAWFDPAYAGERWDDDY